jgi:streptogramin lyase
MRIRRTVLLAMSGWSLALPGSAAVADGPATVPPEPGEPVEFGAWTGLRHRLPSPDWLAADEDHVYVRRDTGHVEVLDPLTGVSTASLDVEFDFSGHFCAGIGAGPSGVWSCKSTDVVRVDPNSGEVGAPLGLSKSAEQGHLVNAFEHVWVLIGDGSTLVAVDPGAGTVTDEIELDARCLDVAVDVSSLWVSCALADVVLRIDPAAGAITDRIEIAEPRGVAFSTGAVWLGGVSATVRLDAETLEMVATIDGGVGRVGAIAADDDGVWVRRGGSPLRRIDPATNEVTDELDLGVDSGGDVLVAHGAVWTTAYDDAALFRIDLGSTG